MKSLSRLCCIVGPSQLEFVPLLLDQGIRWIQYRDKTGTKREIYLAGFKLREITKRYDALLIVNDYPDICLAIDADGVHLGQDDLPADEAKRLMGDKIVGISTHNVSEAAAAEKAGADYIGFGPVFPTVTKDAGPAKGIAALEIVVRSVAIPVVAIGGISPSNAALVLGSGCAALAASSGFFSGSTRENARRLLEVVETVRRV